MYFVQLDYFSITWITTIYMYMYVLDGQEPYAKSRVLCNRSSHHEKYEKRSEETGLFGWYMN